MLTNYKGSVNSKLFIREIRILKQLTTRYITFSPSAKVICKSAKSFLNSDVSAIVLMPENRTHVDKELNQINNNVSKYKFGASLNVARDIVKKNLKTGN